MGPVRAAKMTRSGSSATSRRPALARAALNDEPLRRSYSEHNQPPAAASDIRSELFRTELVPPEKGRGVASAKRQILGAPSLSGDRERVSDRRGRQLRFKGLDLARQLDRGEQLGALGDNAS
jgi:hypothetical protein